MKQNKSTQGKGKQPPSKTSSTTYKVIPTNEFIKEAKSLKKKYPNIKEDFFELQQQLKKDPISGNDSLGKSCYKIRMPIRDKGCGDRGGARVIVEVVIMDKIVYVLSVYDKSVQADIEETLDSLLKRKLSA